MKVGNSIETPLTPAFRAASAQGEDVRARASKIPFGNSTFGEPQPCASLAYAQLSALHKEGR
jgi:hypothetical protein